ncbi:MAG: type VII secretion target [Pseudonocardiaceae bacterium]
MGHSFHVDTDQLRRHAAAADDFTSRAGTAADAGRQVASMDNAYGLLCRPIAGLLAGPQQRCADSLGMAAQALRRITNELHASADSYQRIDGKAASNLAKIGAAK